MRSIAISTLLLALATTAGCGTKKPQGTQHPDETATGQTSTPVDSGDAQSGDATDPEKATSGSDASGGDATASSAEDPTKKVCDAKVADTPTALFMETMLIRLPFGLVESALIEQTPFLLLARPFESVGCVEGMDGADVNITAIGYFEDDPKRDIKEIAMELLEAQGYTGTPKIADELVKNRDIEFSAEFPADDKHPAPSKLWVAMKTKYGRSYYALFEVHPNAWNAMKKTLKESTDRIFLLKAEG